MAEKTLYGAVGEFSSPEALVGAARGMRERGFTKLDANTPFPVHGIDQALGINNSPLGFIVMAGGVVGLAAALLLQWWTGAVDYPLVIGGKPLFAFEFSIPITFELTILFSAFCAVGGMFALNGLPRFHHPLFEYDGFKRFSNDRFFLTVEASDLRFRRHEILDTLRSVGAEHAALVEETE